MSEVLDDYRLNLGGRLYVPIMIGGMGVDISTAEMALEAARLGGIGHISDAMTLHVADRAFGTRYTTQKARAHSMSVDSLDKSAVRFDTGSLQEAQRRTVESVMSRKRGPGAVFINVMEKLTMGDALPTLKARLIGALQGGIDGITLSAGLHKSSLRLMEDHPRFRDVQIGIIVSSARALRIFLRSARKVGRMPDYVVVEGPLAGGHLGFGADWREHRLESIVAEVLELLQAEDLNMPVIPAGGVFTGTDAVSFMKQGAGAVQVATRFTITREAGLAERAKQAYLAAREDDVQVTSQSPTGYPLRMLKTSPCLGSNVKPQCEPFGYALDNSGQCSYLRAYDAAPINAKGEVAGVPDKICLCYHFSRGRCYTCGHYVYRLKDTTNRRADGTWQLPTTEHVFNDYLLSRDHQIRLPDPEPPRIPSVLFD